ncbi:MAG TPA: DUF2069 domain-containing protein [Steroidobacteraceae bacterium]|jgi:uncharacterized membrane protein|nr:DUF2069 domain-containing protein [Steroidobacteraceae bacterium]
MSETVASLSLVAARVRIATILIWIALFSLVALHQVLPSLSVGSMLRAFLYSLPLFAPLPGLLRGNRYTYSWATLCVLPYFIVGITETVANPSIHIWATALLGLSLLWFFSLISFLRVTRA